MRYKLTVLTPLLVGDGRALSPVDYMVWKDQVNVLDQTRIFKLLARGPRLEGYLTQLRKATKLDFASWGGFAQNFSQRRIPFEDAGMTAIWNAAPPESLFIPTFAASPQGAYVPASAIKGALRTGLVFSRWSAGTLEKLAASREGDRLPRRASEAAEANVGASQMRIFAPADSQAIPASAFKVFTVRVASLDTRQAGKPQLVWKVAGRGSVPPQRISDSTPFFTEMAVPGTSIAGEWQERNFLENQEFSRILGWRSVPQLSQFIEAANQFAGSQLDLHARYAEMTGLGALGATVQRLQQELDSARNASSSCLLSIGWGSSFLSKSGFLQTDQESYRSLLRALPGIGRSIRDGAVFPKTRRVVFRGGQPSSIPGWTRLELEL
jgi:CRISPR-associated protein Csm5